jgi:hypothetical protein
MKKSRITSILMIFTMLLFSNVKPIDWFSYYTKTMKFVKNDIPNFTTNTIPTFFTAKTNHILKPTPGIIPNSKEMLEQAGDLIANQTKAIKQIPKIIGDFEKLSQYADVNTSVESLDQIKHCIENYNQKTNGLTSFIKENGKLSQETTKRFLGLGKKTILKTQYPIHDSISENGLTSGSPNYLIELTKQQKDNLVEFEQCIENVDGYEKFSNKEWLKTLFKNKKQISEQHLLAVLEKLKYHTREILETITPDNPALKWALIATAGLLTAEAIYALSYGIAKKDLQKGIKNTVKFNWELLKFIPWTMPKYLLFKPANYAFQKTIQRINGNQNGPNVVVNINGNQAVAPGNGQ